MEAKGNKAKPVKSPQCLFNSFKLHFKMISLIFPRDLGISCDLEGGTHFNPLEMVVVSVLNIPKMT